MKWFIDLSLILERGPRGKAREKRGKKDDHVARPSEPPAVVLYGVVGDVTRPRPSEAACGLAWGHVQ